MTELPSPTNPPAPLGSAPPAAPTLYIDADACPVKEEVYRVARRYGLKVYVVANAYIAVPLREPLIERVVVEAGPDIADDWIAERCGPLDIVVTSDIPLAGRCLTAGAQALRPTGRPFDTASIGMALAAREVAEHLRSFGQATSGPPPFAPADRSRFLQALDAAVVKVRRRPPAPPPLRPSTEGQIAAPEEPKGRPED